MNDHLVTGRPGRVTAYKLAGKLAMPATGTTSSTQADTVTGGARDLQISQEVGGHPRACIEPRRGVSTADS